jgi:hypothetical protein
LSSDSAQREHRHACGFTYAVVQNSLKHFRITEASKRFSKQATCIDPVSIRVTTITASVVAAATAPKASASPVVACFSSFRFAAISRFA